jgi:hypothetical protein|tara:strand:- start:275 stop:595 length:321 start_codon:yes stop_codon:yes gene_type:complete
MNETKNTLWVSPEFLNRIEAIEVDGDRFDLNGDVQDWLENWIYSYQVAGGLTVDKDRVDSFAVDFECSQEEAIAQVVADYALIAWHQNNEAQASNAEQISVQAYLV